MWLIAAIVWGYSILAGISAAEALLGRRFAPDRLPTAADVADRRREALKMQIVEVLDSDEGYTTYLDTIGNLAEEHDLISPQARILLFSGLLGGFTTFSAFANETVIAAQRGAPWLAAANVVLSVVLCLAAVWLGRSLVA